MIQQPPSGGGLPQRPPFATGLVLLQAAFTLVLHVTVNRWTPYGIHRDELLYLGMGRHLQLWGMDFPPAIADRGGGVPDAAGRLAHGDPFLPGASSGRRCWCWPR